MAKIGLAKVSIFLIFWRKWPREAGPKPSAPRAAGSSRRDDATAFATVHEKREDHLRRQACSTLWRNKEGTERALARARELRNICVSWDHWPQTSTRTTKRARPRRPTLGTSAPNAVARRPRPPHPRAHVVVRRLRGESDNGSVHSQLGATKERQPISNHLQSPSVCIRFREVEVSHKHVSGDSPASHLANPSNHAFQQIASPPQDPHPRAGCAVVATRVEWNATPAVTRG